MIERLFGRLLRGVRAGEEKLLWNHPAVRSAPKTLILSSPSFQDGGIMLTQYAARRIGGEDQSPPLTWSNVPHNTVELVLVMEDPDAPLPVPSVHLLVAGISPHVGKMAAGGFNCSVSSPVHFGKWLLRKAAYRGPMPPSSHGPHRYVFQMFALEQALGLDAGFHKQALLRELDGKVRARGRLTGVFERK